MSTQSAATLNTDKVKALLDVIDSASCITVDDSPLLNSWGRSDVSGDADNEILNFNWNDGEGFEYSVSITEAALSNANWDGGNLKLEDGEGTHTVISIYSLQPINIVKTW